jgi:hypothetical protein
VVDPGPAGRRRVGVAAGWVRLPGSRSQVIWMPKETAMRSADGAVMLWCICIIPGRGGGTGSEISCQTGGASVTRS